MKTVRHILLGALLLLCIPVQAQNTIIKEFKACCDTVSMRASRKMGVHVKLEITDIRQSGTTLNFTFSETLGDFPWRQSDTTWFRDEFKSHFPAKYSKYDIGTINVKGGTVFEEYMMPEPSTNGKPAGDLFRVPDRRGNRARLAVREGEKTFNKGLSYRYIALWQSHGIYFDKDKRRWIWQRPPLFQTIEDIYTQTYVIPFLVPMLENAGAEVLLPRERDWQRDEVIVDETQAEQRHSAEKSLWTDGGAGWGNVPQVLDAAQNPFQSGATLKASQKKVATDSIIWNPVIHRKGSYAVYVSYRTVRGSTPYARYTVHHSGGDTRFTVNQSMGGGTWVYLGTFDFDEGVGGYVMLDNGTPADKKYAAGRIVTADAVKIGGGMGNVSRGGTVSGMPRFLEGARYWLQWAGADQSVYNPQKGLDDYKDDYQSRGYWVNWLVKSKGIPVDLAMAFHTDAGVYRDNSLIGTLGIYTMLDSKKKREFSGNRGDRMASRELCDFVQTQVVSDIRSKYDKNWVRRQLWDRGYAESRTPDVPTLLLELLSHQNFADMRFGLDPEFRFTVSRAVYKGMLKFLSERYGCSYAVQPLPVHCFSAVPQPGDSTAFQDSCSRKRYDVRLSWCTTPDPLEETAKAKSFIVYTRIDGKGWDNGTEVALTTVKAKSRNSKRTTTVEAREQGCTVSVEPGHIYSYKVVAVGDGGYSFPSEVLSVGIPEKAAEGGFADAVLAVNNFTRTSGPTFACDSIAPGFNNRIDSGVPYLRDGGYCGEMYDRNPAHKWKTNDDPGFGASFTDYTGRIIAGNTFDFPYVHGEYIMEAGRPFCSCSVEAFTLMDKCPCGIVDLICGKQVTTIMGRDTVSTRFTVFPDALQSKIREFTGSGINFIVSGANIARDIWSSVYPVTKDPEFTSRSAEFAENVLGYRYGVAPPTKSAGLNFSADRDTFHLRKRSYSFAYNNRLSEDIYSVENPDILEPARGSGTILEYNGNNASAAICHRGDGYSAVCIGFPIEVITDKEAACDLVEAALEYIKGDERK